MLWTLRWRHNDHAGVSNHQPHGCLLNRLFRRISKKTSKLRVTGLCAGNSPGTGEFPAQMASYAEMFPFDDVIMKIGPCDANATMFANVFCLLFISLFLPPGWNCWCGWYFPFHPSYKERVVVSNTRFNVGNNKCSAIYIHCIKPRHSGLSQQSNVLFRQPTFRGKAMTTMIHYWKIPYKWDIMVMECRRPRHLECRACIKWIYVTLMGHYRD